jgi:two-component sensor histidine kinase
MRAIRLQNEVADPVASSESMKTSEYLLVRELAHRINNEYASLIGVSSRMASRSSSDEVKAALFEVINLLHNYADMHRALQIPTYSSAVDASKYIRTLCQSIKRAVLDRRGIEMVLSESALHLDAEKCWKLGMIVSELITNSARHAFGDRGGTIRIELSSIGPFAQCSFMDDGSSRHSSTPGQGLKIMAALASGLNGEIVHRFGTEGATSVLIFPIDDNTLQSHSHLQLDGGDWIAANAESADATASAKQVSETAGTK